MKYFFGMAGCIFLFVLSSCTVYRNTSDIKSEFGQFTRNSKDYLLRLQNDLAEKDLFLSEITKDNPEANQMPYSGLKRIFTSLQLDYQNFETLHQESELLKSKVQDLIQNKKRIVSDQPEWKQSEVLIHRAKEINQKQNEILKAYESRHKDFVKLMDDNRIIKVKVGDMLQELNDFKAKTEKAITEETSAISKSRTELEARKNIFNAARIKEIETIFTALDDILRTFKNIGSEIDQTIQLISTSYQGKEYAYFGPGRTNPAEKEIQAQLQHYTALVERHNAEIKKLDPYRKN